MKKITRELRLPWTSDVYTIDEVGGERSPFNELEVFDADGYSILRLPNKTTDANIVAILGIIRITFDQGVQSGKNIKMDEIRRALNVPAIPVGTF